MLKFASQRQSLIAASCVSLSVLLSACGGGGSSSADQAGGIQAAVVQSASQDTAAAGAPAATTTSTSVARSATDAAGSTVFSPNSFWYQPIPADAALHSNSANMVADFLRQKQAYYGNVMVNTNSYSSPVYVADANTPTVAVKMWDCQGKGYVDQALEAQWASVPVPAFAKPSGGTDGEMTVYQPSTGGIWEFWQTKNENGQWQACWGGQMKNAAASNGLFDNPYGTTATGLPFIGGQVTAEELQKGEINHVVGIALVELEKSSIFSWPATRSDGYNPDNAPNRIPEGTRMRLDPSINVDALNIHPIAKMVAKAAQKYGFVVWDKAGAISIRLQNAQSYTDKGQADPYPALFNGTADYALLDGFPWEKLQILPMDYGKQ
ncbi:hypothetical protein SAMN06265795_10875 [Noviherbaspirillum humi]|uniref:DUF4124 domain-containing protein n=1 Tax=Noviherbaspirillum humi TaxID=1688639 RepID=A0A239I5K2_9BURK|nr:DUF4124 domain-containing protein [Noviherbaspirillum humi]SNS87614.1 hypothetical protein SAMN06265795_10875 [Noviherbaspirillum humi]